MFDTFGIDIASCLTLSSYSLEVFRTLYYDIKTYPISHLMDKKDAFVRRSFFGGCVEVYKPYLKNGYYYDVNSLFPYVMSNFDMPVDKGIFRNLDDSIYFDLENFFGFLDVTIVAPKGIYIPLLLVRDEKKGLIAPTGTFTGVFFSEELKYAQTLGYSIIFYHKGLEFKKGQPFKTFVDDLYKLRLDNRNSGLDFIFKRMLNSLYGRLGMKNELNFSEILNDINALEKSALYKLKNITQLNKDQKDPKVLLEMNSTINQHDINLLVKEQVLSKDKLEFPKEHKFWALHLKTAVQISSSVTSYARIVMHKYKMQCKTVYYSDTDSIFTGEKLPSDLVSESTLGKFKLVYEVNEAVFITSKSY
jgi:hypothetical protein